MAESNPTYHEKMSTYFQSSATAVVQTLDRWDKSYLQPNLVHVTRSFQTRPIYSIFLSVFAVLSFLPIISFIGFALFVFGTCTFFALAGAFLISAIAIAFVAFFVVVTLAIHFCVSAFLTNVIFSCYLTFRYVLLVRAGGPRDGSIEWAREVKRHLRGSGTAAVVAPPSDVVDSKEDAAPRSALPEGDIKEEEKQEDDRSIAESEESVMDDSTIIVEGTSPDTRSKYKDLDDQESPVFVKQELDLEEVTGVPATTA